MARFRVMLVLIAFVAAMAAPRLALAIADHEGLLYETLAVSSARQRTQNDESRRDIESRALELANMATSDAFLAPQGVTRRDTEHDSDAQSLFEQDSDGEALDAWLADSADLGLMAARAPPMLLPPCESVLSYFSSPEFGPSQGLAFAYSSRAPPIAL